VSSNASETARYQARQDAVLRLARAQPVNFPELEKAVREFIRDFPDRSFGYAEMAFLMSVMLAEQQPDDELKRIDRVRALAKEMEGGPAPEPFKLWARGLIRRVDAIELSAAHTIADGSAVDVPEQYKLWAKDTLARLGPKDKPLTLEFTAADGRKVDLSKMRGKVVLVDFWAIGCPSYIAEFPKVKALYDKHHSQGFEILGVSRDHDNKRFAKFIKEKRIPWPQYFDGKDSPENRIFQEFGIWGVPHTILVDKNGRLRGYDLSVENLEVLIPTLLAKQ